MIRIDYFGDWRKHEFTCPKCGWVGLGAELESELYDALFTLECPTNNCWHPIAGAPYPTLEELEAAARRGHPDAVQTLEMYGKAVPSAIDEEK